MSIEDQKLVGTLSIQLSTHEGAPTLLEVSEGEVYRIGRVRTNDIVLEEPKVSRFHAILSVSSLGVLVSDLSSLNGTFLNGKRLSNPRLMNAGDVLRIGDSTIALEMGTAKQTLATQHSVQTQAMGLESMVVTVFLADVCSYTRKTEKYPPEEVTAILQAWFEAVSGVVEDHGGEVDKYLGDCVMAVWKGPTESAAERANNACLAAERTIELTSELSFNHPWKYEADDPWDCRVALSTGEALMGSVGGSKREITVLGDTVNIAFRLESLAGELDSRIVMNHDTASLLRDQNKLIGIGKVEVEGRRAPVKVFKVSL